MEVSHNVHEIAWEDFLPRFKWRQGEHVSLVGPTGGGKTTLALEILERRRLVTVFANKPRDDTMDKLVKRPGWSKITKFEGYDPKKERTVLWPKGDNMESYEAVQRKVYLDALRQIWAIGYYCIFFDEVRYICDNLKLRRQVELFWQQARALKVSVVACTQRPAFVPVLMFDQATHLFFWCDNDEYNLKRIGGLGATNAKLIRETVGSLAPHHVLYLNTRTGEMLVTLPKPGG
jgi:hypothetical protein